MVRLASLGHEGVGAVSTAVAPQQPLLWKIKLFFAAAVSFCTQCYKQSPLLEDCKWKCTSDGKATVQMCSAVHLAPSLASHCFSSPSAKVSRSHHSNYS